MFFSFCRKSFVSPFTKYYFVMESNEIQRGIMFIPSSTAVVSLFKFTLSALPLQRQSPGSCYSISHSIADEGGASMESEMGRRIVESSIL